MATRKTPGTSKDPVQPRNDISMPLLGWAVTPHSLGFRPVKPPHLPPAIVSDKRPSPERPPGNIWAFHIWALVSDAKSAWLPLPGKWKRQEEQLTEVTARQEGVGMPHWDPGGG